MVLGESSASLESPSSIIFLYIRQAMIFISATLGTVNIVRRVCMSGIEGLNKMITAMIFMVTMVLWKEQCVSRLGTRQTKRELTGSRPVHLVITPWRILADSLQRPKV